MHVPVTCVVLRGVLGTASLGLV